MNTTFFPAPDEPLFCSQCAGSITHQIPSDDNRLRAVCLHCGAIHYRNPRIVVGTLTRHNQKILLCKRAIEPRSGYWTLPAGFMELSETSQAGAIRETYEESGVHVQIEHLLSVIQIPQVNQVHLYYLANTLQIEATFGSETTEVKWVTPDEIPWSSLAFESVKQTLQAYLTAPDTKVPYEIDLSK